MHYEQHPLSAAFPAMSDAEYAALVDSITNIGVQNPITLYEGKVLDGWNRYRASCDLVCACPETPLAVGVDPVDFVRAQNKHRRHLPLGAWALIEVSLSAWKPSHRPDKGELSSPFQRSNEEMAAKAGVTVRTIQHAKVVEANAAPEVKEAVKTGVVSVKAAAEIARLPKEEQAAAISAPPPPKPAKFKGKPKKGPAADLVRAELKAARAKGEVGEATARIEELEAELSALREQLAEARDDLEAAVKVLDASDQVAAALAEAKKVRDLNRGLQSRIDSMLTEIARLKGSVKHWERKAGQPA
ncbi:hypothetical protein C7T35_15330 [Variovorax sp. WS11]|uniref:hypothetical protein n=1 Tax=Variovorax sp. WS11 TaxID=1105204 RepID=UPI000D0D630D|nr:hypothetical protein [Variovorax sp. WS11]NDZ12066.1 hypothetical protein [Variovorax sp. WS11]PSL83753.1 hypothetical protein C7T35_15330 [Variovorax sp. WS11]